MECINFLSLHPSWNIFNRVFFKAGATYPFITAYSVTCSPLSLRAFKIYKASHHKVMCM